MLDKDEVKAEHRFAHDARSKELASKALRLGRLVDALPHGTEEYRDARYCLRIVEEELASRADVRRIHAQYDLNRR